MGMKKISNKEYREKISARYGEDSLEDFDAIFSGDITLTKISKKYKISKMRATQIFGMLYGTGFRQVKRNGGVTDSTGKHFSYEPGKTKQFMIILSVELDVEITKQAKSANKSKAAFIRDCIIDCISKDDPMSGIAKQFGL